MYSLCADTAVCYKLQTLLVFVNFILAPEEVGHDIRHEIIIDLVM